MTTPDLPDLSAVPLLPADGDSPVFAEPWEAQAFAMAITLHRAGHFSWSDWVESLAAEIRDAGARGEPDRGDTYYRHWLLALERLAVERGLVDVEELRRRRAAWEEAARRTPHGEPILLPEA